MSDPFIGEIRMFAGNFAPNGHALCDGQLLSVSQNNALFALLGTTFGGAPMACAAIEAVITAIREENLLANVRECATMIREACLMAPVTSIRGAGFLLGLHTEIKAVALRDALLEKDILTGGSGDPHVLRLLPPLVLGPRHVEQFAAALGELAHG